MRSGETCASVGETAEQGSVLVGQSSEAAASRSTASDRNGSPRKAVREVFIDSSSGLSFAASLYRAIFIPVCKPYFWLSVPLVVVNFIVGGQAIRAGLFFEKAAAAAVISTSLHEAAHALCLASRDYAHDLSVRVYFMKICVVTRREHSVKRLIIAAVAGPFAGAISALILGFAFNMLPIAYFIAGFNLLNLIPPADDGMRILEAAKAAKTAKTAKTEKS